MAIITLLHGMFFQRDTGQGHCLAGVIHIDATLEEGHEYVARHTDGKLTLDTQAVSTDKALRKVGYHDMSVSCMLKQPIWKTTADPAFFTLRAIPLTGGSYLVYSARLAPFFATDTRGDTFFALNGQHIAPIPSPLKTAGEAINSIIRQPIWPLTADDAAQGRYVSIEPTSTPLLALQNQVKALFLQFKRGEITKEQAYDQIPNNFYMLNTILQDDIYSAYLLKSAEHAPLITTRITDAQAYASREERLKTLVASLIED